MTDETGKNEMSESGTGDNSGEFASFGSRGIDRTFVEGARLTSMIFLRVHYGISILNYPNLRRFVKYSIKALSKGVLVSSRR